ncbi:MAG: GGDEF domain-containing phosphodiesterase [Lachnospiraceae bacterium]|nr:GGDEF domain-containing phosphodiesterase [Lachnospiraceae bacterium]
MEKLTAVEDPQQQDILMPIARMLSIGRIIAQIYSTPEQVAMEKPGEVATIYEDTTSELTLKQNFKYHIDNGSIAEYVVYHSESCKPWDEEDIRHIELIVKMLYTFHGRIRIKNLVHRMTFYDRELGIYSLAYFMRLASMLCIGGRIGEFGACYFNVKHFSIVNQLIGRPKGTLVLRNYALGLQNLLGTEDEAVCRVGSDNFVALFRKKNLDIVRDYLISAMVPYDDADGQIELNSYTGYYLIPDSCDRATDIMDACGLAIQFARRDAKADFAFYDDGLKEKQNDIRMLENIFPAALENREFKVYYQPKVSLETDQLAGAEALVRWFHEGKFIVPDRFIPSLEQSRAICKLDFYMLEEVCKDLRRWLDEGKQIVRVSVNMSRRHMGDIDLLDDILDIIDKYEIPHEYLEIELTETTTDVNFKDLKAAVHGLQAAGVKTSVDDFGVGYSSLNLVRESPWDVLKLDKSFLPTADDHDPQKKIMMDSLISMFQNMGLECIVEGVETYEQVMMLKEDKCQLAQGYFYDKPMPMEEFERKLLTEGFFQYDVEQIHASNTAY